MMGGPTSIDCLQQNNLKTCEKKLQASSRCKSVRPSVDLCHRDCGITGRFWVVFQLVLRQSVFNDVTTSAFYD